MVKKWLSAKVYSSEIFKICPSARVYSCEVSKNMPPAEVSSRKMHKFHESAEPWNLFHGFTELPAKVSSIKVGQSKICMFGITRPTFENSHRL